MNISSDTKILINDTENNVYSELLHLGLNLFILLNIHTNRE